MHFIAFIDTFFSRIIMKFVHVNLETILSIKVFRTNTACVNKLAREVNTFYVLHNVIFLSICFATKVASKLA